MTHSELLAKLTSGDFQNDRISVQEALLHVPDAVVRLLEDSKRIEDSPHGRPGEYRKTEKKLIIYGHCFDPAVFFHELGHCIYHEFEGAQEFATEAFYRTKDSDPLWNYRVTGKSSKELEDEYSEFMARAYQHFKGGDLPSDWEVLVPFFDENLSPYFEENNL